jgi:hypothetical protein
LPSSAFDSGEFFASALKAPENVILVIDRIQQIGDFMAQKEVMEENLLASHCTSSIHR